jgi:hypothetical protein
MKPKYRPKKTKHGWGWQCAFADCFAHHYVLPGHFWDLLGLELPDPKCPTCKSRWDSDSSLWKYYKTEEDAMKQLKSVLTLLEKQLEEYKK